MVLARAHDAGLLRALHEVADRLSDLGAGLSGLDRVGTARGKHEQCGGVARQ